MLQSLTVANFMDPYLILLCGGEDDATSKGRFIPKISVDQMNASLCSWFGANDSIMSTLFPNLQNFKTSSAIDSAYLKKDGTKLFS